MNSEIEYVASCCEKLQKSMTELTAAIGDIQIGNNKQFPYGWRKAAKGRTVWRLLEEAISQNLEAKAKELGMRDFQPASSEVGVYDFSFHYDETSPIYVNIKSAVKGGRTNKDDISKAIPLLTFMTQEKVCVLLVATIVIEFISDPHSIRLSDCHVVPVAWLPDVYVNPSNNGNLQSGKYKNIDEAVRRTTSEFLTVLDENIKVALGKKGKRAASMSYE